MASRRSKRNFQNRLYERRKELGLEAGTHPNKGSMGMQDPALQAGEPVRVMSEKTLDEALQSSFDDLIHHPAPQGVLAAIHQIAARRLEVSAE